MKGYFDKQYHIQPHIVKLATPTTFTTGGTVTFPEPYLAGATGKSSVECWVVRALGDTGVWEATPSDDGTGATLTITTPSTMTTGVDFFVVIISHEKV